MRATFETLYPTINRWIEEFGWIEIGADDNSSSLIRVLDEGGMIWELGDGDISLDQALRETDEALARYIKEELGM